MIGSVSISDKDLEVSVATLRLAWDAFRLGKRWSPDLLAFWYHLEDNLAELHDDLIGGSYRHGGYWVFTVTDNKRRQISVAPVRDRVVHRLVYDYLVARFDHTFIYDLWSCRKHKGLLGAITRTQEIFSRHRSQYVWRVDIRKFFDHVDHRILKRILARRVRDLPAVTILNQIIDSYRAQSTGADTRERERESFIRPVCRLVT